MLWDWIAARLKPLKVYSNKRIQTNSQPFFVMIIYSYVYYNKIFDSYRLYNNNIMYAYAVLIIVVPKKCLGGFEKICQLVFLVGCIMLVWLIFPCKSYEVKTPPAHNSNMIIILRMVYFRMQYSFLSSIVVESVSSYIHNNSSRNNWSACRQEFWGRGMYSKNG